MSQTIDYYFDFSSSYSYIAHARIDEIETETACTVVYRPIVLGIIFQQQQHAVPSGDSVKMRYMAHDLKRCATELNLKFAFPRPFPFNAMHAMRMFYAIDASDSLSAKIFSQSAFTAAFAEQQDLSDAATVEAIVEQLGLDYQSLTSDQIFESAKAELKQNTQRAVQAGVFGAPSFVYNGELYWGSDRIDTLINHVKGRKV